MTLIKYMKLKGLSMTAMGALLGVTRTTVSRYLSGERKPDYEMLKLISEVTKGKVPIQSFILRKYKRKRASGGNAGLTVGKV